MLIQKYVRAKHGEILGWEECYRDNALRLCGKKGISPNKLYLMIRNNRKEIKSVEKHMSTITLYIFVKIVILRES
jgi:hypothetical protein